MCKIRAKGANRSASFNPIEIPSSHLMMHSFIDLLQTTKEDRDVTSLQFLFGNGGVSKQAHEASDVRSRPPCRMNGEGWRQGNWP